MSVSVIPFLRLFVLSAETVAGAELREGGAVLARKRGFCLGDVRCLEVEDPVR